MGGIVVSDASLVSCLEPKPAMNLLSIKFKVNMAFLGIVIFFPLETDNLKDLNFLGFLSLPH